jgi:hypothetical protein
MTVEVSIDVADAIAAVSTPTGVALTADLVPAGTEGRFSETCDRSVPGPRVSGAAAIMTPPGTPHPEIAPTAAPEQRARCLWCDQPFTRRMEWREASTLLWGNLPALVRDGPSGMGAAGV